MISERYQIGQGNEAEFAEGCNSSALCNESSPDISSVSLVLTRDTWEEEGHKLRTDLVRTTQVQISSKRTAGGPTQMSGDFHYLLQHVMGLQLTAGLPGDRRGHSRCT